MWLAECVKQCGNWFTFVAAYSVIAELSASDAATHTALFLICRRLPYLLLFPLTGAAADRLNRGALLVAVCLAQGAVSFALPLVRARGSIGLLYPLVLLQYSAQAFYDPARTAAVPHVVSAAHICAAGTLDTFGFSLMALGGASAAGRTADMYGTAVCFRVEGLAFLIAAALLLRLARQPVGQQRRPAKAPVSIAVDARADAPPELQPLLAAGADEGPAGGVPEQQDGGGPEAGCCVGGCGALRFLAARANRDVAVLIFAKATGALCWGAADVINGRFIQTPSMQSLGGPDRTLGAIIAAVGLGCVAGPLAGNALTPGAARYWRVSIAVSFCAVASGYWLMAAAGSIRTVLLATMLRAAGGNTLWVHSLATLQHRLPSGVRGRVFAVEYVLYTFSESASTLFGGFALDQLGWSARQLCTRLASMGTVFACLWALHARLLWAGGAYAASGSGAVGGGPLLVEGPPDGPALAAPRPLAAPVAGEAQVEKEGRNGGEGV